MSIIKIDYGELNSGGSSIFDSTELYSGGLKYGTVETNKSASATAEDTGSYLRVYVPNSANVYSWLGIKVDLTDVDIIAFRDISVSSYASNAQYIYASPSMGTTTMVSGAVYKLTTGAGLTHNEVLDVSSLTGENYVGICVYTGSGGGVRETTCDRIVLLTWK